MVVVLPLRFGFGGGPVLVSEGLRSSAMWLVKDPSEVLRDT